MFIANWIRTFVYKDTTSNDTIISSVWSNSWVTGDAKSEEFLTWCFDFPISGLSSEDNSSAKPYVGESVEDTVGHRGMFSLCNFGSPYSRRVAASEIFNLKLASFVILLDPSRLFMNLLRPLVVDAVGLVLNRYPAFFILNFYHFSVACCSPIPITWWSDSIWIRHFAELMMHSL